MQSGDVGGCIVRVQLVCWVICLPTTPFPMLLDYMHLRLGM
jgi:hypothetical protein